MELQRTIFTVPGEKPSVENEHGVTVCVVDVPPPYDLNKKIDDDVDDDDAPEDDPWALPEIGIVSVPWNELTTSGKFKRVLWDYTFRQIVLLGLLYLFICSLSILSSAFRLLGGRQAGEVLGSNELLTNPIAGLMIGVLATVLVQSSSTSTSIVVAMVGAKIINVRQAIPIVMGANIGTSVTNTIVAFGQIAKKNEFRRAFAGATVHDMFNWLCVLILLPVELITGYLYKLSNALLSGFDESLYGKGKVENPELLKVITKPFTSAIITLDKKVITKISLDPDSVPANQSLISYKTPHMFSGVEDLGWSDAAVGVCVLILALFILTTCLFFIVKLLQSALQGPIAAVIRRIVNSDLPIPGGAYITGYLLIIFGILATILVQSSSIFTSSITPLVGAGVISLERMYPFTLGSNIGTTATGVLAAIAGSGDLRLSLQIALCHLFFNVTGILIWYPIPVMRKAPIGLAKFLGNTTAKYRWFAIAYLITVFFLFPLVIFGLSWASWIALAAVMIPVAVLIIAIAIIKVIQAKKPGILPVWLRTWKFLPEPMRSLAPYHKAFTFCCRCKGCKTYGD